MQSSSKVIPGWSSWMRTFCQPIFQSGSPFTLPSPLCENSCCSISHQHLILPHFELLPSPTFPCYSHQGPRMNLQPHTSWLGVHPKKERAKPCASSLSLPLELTHSLMKVCLVAHTVTYTVSCNPTLVPSVLIRSCLYVL